MLEVDLVCERVKRIGLVIDFLREHEDAFTSFEKKQILDTLDCDYILNMHNYICLEVYDGLGLLPDSLNPYKAFLKLLDDQFDVKNKNIIEIGGGKIPCLAKRISSIQNMGCITVYDPNLIEDGIYDNLILRKRRFTSITNVSNADILVGLLPCGSSSIIVSSAVRYNKDFMIALCDSHNNLELFDDVEENLDWPDNFIEEVKTIVEDNAMGKLKVKRLNEIGDNYPIIYNDRG